jgi:hypothetical protein
LQQFNRGYNGNQWALHFLDDFSKMHFVYTLLAKDQTTRTIQHFTAFVQRQFQYPVRVFRTDNGSSLGRVFHDWVRSLGIALEFSAAYAHQRNGSAERSGGVLATKANAIRIESQVPEQLWPEAMRAAGYLTDCSPTRSLGWISPIVTLSKAVKLPHPRPYLGHPCVYSCQAYAHIPEAKRLQKEKLLEPALIGYLVGYDSTNTFCVWISSKTFVISIRDVTFDESLFYNPREPALCAPLPKNVEEIIEAITITEIPESTALITQLDDISTTVHNVQQPVEAEDSAPEFTGSSKLSGSGGVSSEAPHRALITP